MNYHYDGTFFGFLTAVFDAYHDGIRHVAHIHSDAERSLFGQEKEVGTDAGKAVRVLQGLKASCGKEAVHFLYYAFLAETAEREPVLLYYIRRLFTWRQTWRRHLSDELIWQTRLWAQKTGNERHKLLGLLRFQKLSDGMLYGPVAPTAAVVPLLAPHFIRRFPEERWIIHDRRRGVGVLYEQHETAIVEIPCSRSPDLAAEELCWQSLWQRYYRTAAIEERRNELLRRSFMPYKYWPDLIEMK
ncbi:TIGR03915 family putative DNA repair protein [Megasphaera vaginalis (ex Bordigoni et al. 2020)]|uniref:TIGR03915 family putative DNA repair protein n=1 Tax=Megasphaera vaginalis (ex Bordigoni et al. 2020) TaxID=2045301 RepID=UPI000C79E5AF|nr:TIGR03915 family putative DNA repair protein [Megasphaera vaginalis (ex Bordigoni et al. 2020)]